MKVSQFKDYNELPLFLNAELVAKVLGVSPSSGYDLMHEPGFPVLKVGAVWSYSKRNSSSGWNRTPAEVVTDETTTRPYWLAPP